MRQGNSSGRSVAVAARREALRYIRSQPLQRCTIFSDTKPAIEALKNTGRRVKYFQLYIDTGQHLSTSHQLRHCAALQCMRVYCGISGNKNADAAENAILSSTSTPNILFAPLDANRCALGLGTH